MNTILQRRRALIGMMATAPKNGFVVGSYGAYTVLNRSTIRSTAVQGVKYIPLRDPIIINSGDVIKIKLVEGDMPSVTGSVFLTTNQSLSPRLNIVTGRTPPLDGNPLTITATSSITANYLGFYINSNSDIEHEYSVGLWHNGHRII